MIFKQRCIKTLALCWGISICLGLSLQAQTLHAILVADVQDYDIGESAEKAFNFIQMKMEVIAKNTGMKFNPRRCYKDAFGKAKLLKEIKSLYQVDHFDDALQHVRKDCKIAALTRGPSGAVIVSGEEVHVVGAAPVEKVVDTTGAGDLFAAGFLYGYTHGYSLADSARIGAASAAEAISHFGARPETPLKTILETFPQA